MKADAKESPRLFYAANLLFRPASLVRGSSRRMMSMTASNSSIREYQIDQPSTDYLPAVPRLASTIAINTNNDGVTSSRSPPRTQKTDQEAKLLDGSLHIRTARPSRP